MSTSSATVLRLLALGLILGGLTGCAAVKPWERGVLSHPAMDMTPTMDEAFRGHVMDVREGSLGGVGGLGGGCGCG
ncbi:MAG TPA: DUF4266 domain-containing protein [Myxococcota bacterium]|nr:DUF4266 domain-containing protein [Myxococcota bacterium]